nr:lamin tail domain-containing protein [Halomarina oriensis]
MASFVSGGGVLFLHDQADYSNYDETANANAVAQAVGAGFRFNDDQVVDSTNNAGSTFQPTTTNFNTAFPFFADRDGLELDKSRTYAAPVTDVLDGDTVKVDLDGTVESIRVLGIDTPEKSANQQYERTQEWEGIEDLPTLADYGQQATDYATARLSGETVDVAFDPEEPTRDAFGRVLAYLYYDADGSGSRDTLYNEEIVTDGLTRVYDSGLSRHDAFRAEEQAARDAGLGLWAASDPASSSEIRNRDVTDLFFPTPATVRTDSGAVDASRVPVSAESTASQTVYSGGQSYSGDLPLAAVDAAANVAMVGSPFVDESYESAEGYAVDTSSYENFVFLTNLIDSLTDRTGDVVVDGGHGQFGADYALSVEDAAYYKRYLEGVGLGFEQVNDVANADLSGARAYVVTTPPEAFTRAELDALTAFRDAGGAVVLLGSGDVFSGPRSNLDAVASALGSDLRLNADSVTDASSNVNGDSSVPATTSFDGSFPLFSAYSDTNDGGDTGGSGDGVTVTTVNYDAAGDDGSNLNDEYVVLENTGGASVDLTGWTLSDAADHVYTFPTFSLDAGATVTVHTGSGSDTATALYWGNGSPLWNNGGDTATLADDTGAVVDEYTYPDDEGGDGDSGSGDLAIAQIHEDAQGNDRNNMNDEYVVFENTGTAALDLTDWQVSDSVGKTYTFPSFSLAAGAQVTLHTGSGSDTASDLYWSASGPVWNNGGDTVTVTDDAGTTVVSRSY